MFLAPTSGPGPYQVIPDVFIFTLNYIDGLGNQQTPQLAQLLAVGSNTIYRGSTRSTYRMNDEYWFWDTSVITNLSTNGASVTFPGGSATNDYYAPNYNPTQATNPIDEFPGWTLNQPILSAQANQTSVFYHGSYTDINLNVIDVWWQIVYWSSGMSTGKVVGVAWYLGQNVDPGADFGIPIKSPYNLVAVGTNPLPGTYYGIAQAFA
jgi:hypothetical protein